MSRWVPLLLRVAVAGRFAPVLAESDKRETYVLKVEAKGRGEVTFGEWNWTRSGRPSSSDLKPVKRLPGRFERKPRTDYRK